MHLLLLRFSILGHSFYFLIRLKLWSHVLRPVLFFGHHDLLEVLTSRWHFFFLVHWNCKVDLLLDLWIPSCWSGHIHVRYYLEGWLKNLDWQRYDVPFAKLVPGVMLHEALQSVLDRDELACHSCRETPQHDYFVWMNFLFDVQFVHILLWNLNLESKIPFLTCWAPMLFIGDEVLGPSCRPMGAVVTFVVSMQFELKRPNWLVTSRVVAYDSYFCNLA